MPCAWRGRWCITSPIMCPMDIAANALLAIGASPAMVHAREEVAEFIGIAGALVINIGTLSASWVDSMIVAAEAAGRSDKPWVLDPVGAGATRLRTDTVKTLLPRRPSIIRGNASEIMAVAGGAGAAPKGVDSANTTEEALAFAVSLAKHQRCTVIATGAVDIVTDGEQVVQLGKRLAGDGEGYGPGLRVVGRHRGVFNSLPRPI